MAKRTTLKKLFYNQCYCLKKNEDIPLKTCTLFDCSRWKKCMKKTNADVDKDLKRRERNVKAS